MSRGKRISSIYWPNTVPFPHSFQPSDTVNASQFCSPLVTFLRHTGFLQSAPDKTASWNEHLHYLTIRILRSIYIILMWIWAAMMTINIFYIALVGLDSDGTRKPHANIVVTLLEEAPFSLIALRNAAVLTIFLQKSEQIVEGIVACEEVRCRFIQNGVGVSLHKFRHRPRLFLGSAVLVIIFWEIYEWTVWFGTMGIAYKWDMTPFPFFLYHYFYATLWLVFISVPFILSQVILCFPVLFAYINRRHCRSLNKEIAFLTQLAREERFDLLDELCERISVLRMAHFDICTLMEKLDRCVSRMLLVQFILDVFTLFGFTGLLVNSKDAKPPLQTLEWTFYIPTAIGWFGFFLFHFQFPMIHLAEESEKTHRLVYELTFSSPTLLNEKFREVSLFLQETQHATIAFTGGKFYYINRHYIVTCVALLASYLTVLTEILDRFYGTEEVKHAIAMLTEAVKNATNSSFETGLHFIQGSAESLAE